MNTLNGSPTLSRERQGDYVLALDGLEFAFPVRQLEEIKRLNNEGYGYKEISKKVRRNKYEVIIALLEINRQGHEVGHIGGWKNVKRCGCKAVVKKI